MFDALWQYIDACGCVIPILAFTDVQLRSTNHTICVGQTAEDGRFPTSPTEPRDGLRTLLCLLRMDEADMKPCSCRLPCDEHVYDVAVSASGSWPHESYRRAFYDQFVSGHRYEERLSRFLHSTVVVFCFFSNLIYSCAHYRAMLRRARYCHRMLSVRLSVCLSVCPSVCNVEVYFSHRLEYFENNFTAE